MKLSESLAKIYANHWSYLNNFNVVINFKNETISSFIGWNDGHDLSINVVSFTTPQYSTKPIEEFVADKWIIDDGTPQPFEFSITIRDQDGLKYYRTFMLLKLLQQKLYFDDYSFNIALYKEPDYISEDRMEIFRYEDCKIENVSTLTFSNEEETKIAQFDVQIKCVNPLFNTADIG